MSYYKSTKMGSKHEETTLPTFYVHDSMHR